MRGEERKREERKCEKRDKKRQKKRGRGKDRGDQSHGGLCAYLLSVRLRETAPLPICVSNGPKEMKYSSI